MWWKCDYLLGQLGNIDETHLYNMPVSITLMQKDQNQFLSNQEYMKNDSNCDAISSGWWEKAHIVYYSEGNHLKDKLPKIIMFKCNEKGWMREEINWTAEKSLGQKTRSSSEEKEEYWVLILSRVTQQSANSYLLISTQV